MKVYLFTIIIFLYSLLLTGCGATSSDMRTSLKLPWQDNDMESTGITRNQIIASWGHPDQIIDNGFDKWGNPKEEWIYIAAYPDMELPINCKYVKNSSHFHFLGNTVIKRTINPTPINNQQFAFYKQNVTNPL